MSENRKDYSYLQNQIDQLSFMMGGSQNIIDFLDTIIHSKSDDTKISSFITLSTINYFNITSKDMVESGERTPVKARMISYVLHHTMINKSIRECGKIYDRKESAVFHALKRIEEVKKDPKLDIELYNAFMKIKEQAEKFKSLISKING